MQIKFLSDYYSYFNSILAVSGIEEVVQDVEFVKELNLSSSSLASTSTSSSNEHLQLLSSGNDQEDILFTVVDDNSSVIHLDSSKTLLETVALPNDLVIEKYYQYGSDVRLVDNVHIEDVKLKDVDLNSSVLNTMHCREDEQLKIDHEELKDSLDMPTYETKKLSDMVSGQVMEIAQDPLVESLKEEIIDGSVNYVGESITDSNDSIPSIPEQENNSSLYPNIVLGYIEGGQPGKTVRLKVHKVTRSDKASKLDNRKLLINSNVRKDETFRCEECCASFAKHEDLKAHMEAHLVKRQNSCALCNIEFPSKSALQMHIKHHFSKAHSCELCSEKFASKGLLRTHKLRKHSNSVSTLTTSADTTKVLNNSPLLSNRAASNGTLLVTSDQIASRKNKNVSATTNNSGDNLVRVFKCSLCQAQFSSRSAMKQHSTSHHHKPYKCDQCGATFTQNGSLQVHIRRHRGEKPFTCALCGNSYTRAFSLKVHMKTHTGEKPHMCEYCSSSFITSSHLNVHRRIHTGERPFSCSECSATFITTSHLNVHKKIHSLANVAPVRCQVCNMTFKDTTLLRLHRKTQHPHLNSKKKRGNHSSSCKCKDCKKANSEINHIFSKDDTINKIILKESSR